MNTESPFFTVRQRLHGKLAEPSVFQNASSAELIQGCGLHTAVTHRGKAVLCRGKLHNFSIREISLHIVVLHAVIRVHSKA